MNFNIVNASLVVVGAILIYCGVKDITPKAALQEIITGSKTKASVGGSQGTAFGPRGGHAGGGGGGGGGGSW